MARKSSECTPLVHDSDSHSPTSSTHNFQVEKACCTGTSLVLRLRRRNKILTIIIVLQSLVLLAAIFTVLSIRKPGSALATENFPYSPARDLLRPEIKVFSDGLEDISVYQGTGSAADDAWEDLYLGTTMRLSREQALLLPNRTIPIENDEGHYIAQLDVFHELHCLNSIRRYMGGEHHPGFTVEHMSHCLESIRQHIMCNIDVSVIVWRWKPEQSANDPTFTHPHKCSNFDVIYRWAKAQEMLPGWNEFKFVEDDLPEPSFSY